MARPDRPAHLGTMALVGTLCALTVWGCDHTYIYRPDNKIGRAHV